MARGWAKAPYDQAGFGRTVKALRTARLRWSQRQLAGLAGVHKGDISHLEQNRDPMRHGYWRPLPAEHRRAVIEALLVGARRAGITVDRAELFRLAGLRMAEPSMSTVSRRTLLRLIVQGVVLTVAAPRTAGGEREGVQARVPSTEPMPSQGGARLDWHAAAQGFRVRADAAQGTEDGATWARSLVEAGQMELNLGRYDRAEADFTQVTSAARTTRDILVRADANVRLGWLEYERDRLDEAERRLQQALGLLGSYWGCPSGEILRRLERDPNAFSDQDEANGHLIRALHFLGSVWERQAQRRPDRQQDRGRRLLRCAFDVHRRLDHPINMGYELLGQIQAVYRRDGRRAATAAWESARDLLGESPPGPAHSALERARLVSLVQGPAQARRWYEQARHGYQGPVYFSAGLARTLGDIAEVELESGGDGGIETALRYALVATLLHPHGERLASLEWIASRRYRQQKRQALAFRRAWDELEARVWQMDEGPFADLRGLLSSYGEEEGRAYLGSGLARVREDLAGVVGL